MKMTYLTLLYSYKVDKTISFGQISSECKSVFAKNKLPDKQKITRSREKEGGRTAGSISKI